MAANNQSLLSISGILCWSVSCHGIAPASGVINIPYQCTVFPSAPSHEFAHHSRAVHVVSQQCQWPSCSWPLPLPLPTGLLSLNSGLLNEVLHAWNSFERSTSCLGQLIIYTVRYLIRVRTNSPQCSTGHSVDDFFFAVIFWRCFMKYYDSLLARNTWISFKTKTKKTIPTIRFAGFVTQIFLP